jgi:hypothetical protein
MVPALPLKLRLRHFPTGSWVKSYINFASRRRGLGDKCCSGWSAGGPSPKPRPPVLAAGFWGRTVVADDTAPERERVDLAGCDHRANLSADSWPDHLPVRRWCPAWYAPPAGLSVRTPGLTGETATGVPDGDAVGRSIQGRHHRRHSRHRCMRALPFLFRVYQRSD